MKWISIIINVMFLYIIIAKDIDQGKKEVIVSYFLKKSQYWQDRYERKCREFDEIIEVKN